MNTTRQTKIGILGQGFVGGAVKFGLEKKGFVNILTYDPKHNPENELYRVVKKSNIIFVCVPTPTNFNHQVQDQIILNELFDKISDCLVLRKKSNKIFVIKSTITPGTTNRLSILHPKLNIVHNPEFLTEVNANDDFANQDRIVIGGNEKNREVVASLYKLGWKKAQYFLMESIEAECVKYFCNISLAVKVGLFNEFFYFVKCFSGNWETIHKAVVSDKRIGKSHTQVPGPDGKMGFGGHCFPKDLVALLGMKTWPNNIMEGAWKTNCKVRENDWE